MVSTQLFLSLSIILLLVVLLALFHLNRLTQYTPIHHDRSHSIRIFIPLPLNNKPQLQPLLHIPNIIRFVLLIHLILRMPLREIHIVKDTLLQPPPRHRTPIRPIHP